MEVNKLYFQEPLKNQALLKGSDLENLDIMIRLGRSICKICSNSNLGSGFFIKLEKGNNDFYCLMTNEHVISKEDVKNKEVMQIYYENQSKNVRIKLDKEERYIQDYKYLNIDIIVIEIIPTKDHIDYHYFLYPNLNYLKGYNQFEGKDIFIPQYPNGGQLKCSKGKIQKIFLEKFKFGHSASTEIGSSGSPIFLHNSQYVIGIHKQGSPNENYANFIGPIIDILKRNYNYVELIGNGESYKGEMNNNKKEGYGKYCFSNGDYYIGQWLNDKMHGKGIKYRKNGTIKYKGQFAENKYRGSGKYVFDNQDYYIGEFDDNQGNGKGKYYNNMGNLVYEGEFVNSIRQGIGTYYYNKDNYYFGNFKNGIPNGEGKYYKDGLILYDGMYANGRKNGNGIQYYKNGSVKYIGEFANDNYEGKGILFFENYNDNDCNNSIINKEKIMYYQGDWKNGEKNGFGKEYYNNGILKYEGQFENNQYNGFGTLYLTCDHNYIYTGSFVKGKMHGKGMINNQITQNEYSFDDNKEMIKYEGDFCNDKMEGFGESHYNNGDSYKGEWENNEFDGEGKYYYKGKLIYEGHFNKGLKSGVGTEYYLDGSKKYSGDFLNDKYNGKGTFYKENGDYYEGDWANGKKHGHLIKYNEYGDIIYEGEFTYDKADKKVEFFFSTIKSNIKKKIDEL